MAPVRKTVATAAPGSQNNNMLKFFNDESPGIHLAPSAVLILALTYVGTVIVLHIMSKIFSGSIKASDVEAAAEAEAAEEAAQKPETVHTEL